jgi:cytochrome c553
LPEHKLREAIQCHLTRLDCFVAEPVLGRREAPIRVLLAMTAEARMRVAVLVAALVAVLSISTAHAADVAAGKAKAIQVCSACHGENGISQMDNVPSLAGQPDQFIQWQLVFFRAGTRKNEQMQPIVAELTNEDIRNLGAYYASLPPPQGKAPDDNPDLSKKGEMAARGRRCASCHTDSFAGTKAVARIAGQREDYLLKALHDYKSGARSGGGMAAMAEVAYPLSEEEIAALAHYLSRL